LTITATVNSGAGGDTITNTASVTNVDQADANSSNDSASIAIDPSATIALTLSAGWTMASCPGEPVNGDVPTLVDGTPVLPYVYTWNPVTHVYDQVDTIQSETCYWFAATEDTQLAIQYQPITTMTCQLKGGWNMMGSVSDDVPVSSLTSVPDDAVLPYIYGWNTDTGAYDMVSTITPGGGYWVAATVDAELTLDGTQPPAAPSARVVKAIKPSWESVISIQTQSQRQKLMFGMHSSASGGFDRLLDKSNPPSPAWGSDILKAGWLINDTHFPLLNGSYVGDDSHASWELSVELSEPGELHWKHLPKAYRCLLQYDGQVIQMRDTKSIYLSEGSHTLTLVLDSFASFLPNSTQLLGNYPNPFNPETWIPYRLSETSDVGLVIYDMSGRKVRQFRLYDQLAGEYQDKEHAVYWDGRNEVGETVSSGVYFYSLQTSGASQTRKLVIIR